MVRPAESEPWSPRSAIPVHVARERWSPPRKDISQGQMPFYAAGVAWWVVHRAQARTLVDVLGAPLRSSHARQALKVSGA
eukprot:1266591-Rhodomonas_salina.1